MMQRCVYRGKCEAGADDRFKEWLKIRHDVLKRYVAENELMTLSFFKWKDNLFTYYECIDRTIHPTELFGDLDGILTQWPGEDKPRLWVPMMDIYHCCEPISEEYWQRKHPVKRTYAMINRLKPEMVSSYIFYHFQYQEEKPGDWAKYASIFLHENLMFFYQEDPDGPEVPPYIGKLDTSNTPVQWQELMNKHFLHWEDDPDMHEPWREIEQILHV